MIWHSLIYPTQTCQEFIKVGLLKKNLNAHMYFGFDTIPCWKKKNNKIKMASLSGVALSKPLGVFSDERTCPPNTFTCQSNKDQNTYPCIDMTRVCDGIRNCHDGEDEQQTCPPRTCQPHQFQCENGICISARFKCDHDNDCGDNSDEPSDCSELNLVSVFGFSTGSLRCE